MSRNATRTYVRFRGPMEPEPVEALITTLNAIAEAEEAHLDFRTDGGTIQEALRLYDALAPMAGRLTTYNTSRIASSGIVPFLAAGTRIASGEAQFVYHPISIRMQINTPQPQTTLYINRGGLIALDRRIRADEELYVHLHRRHTDLTKAAVQKLLSKEHSRDGRWAWDKKIVQRLGDFSPPPGVSVTELRFSPSNSRRAVSP